MKRALLLALLLAACADDPQPTAGDAPTERPWSDDGFLAHLPDGTSIVLRLPPADEVTGPRRATFATLLSRLGWGADPVARLYGAAEPKGIDGGRAPGFARTNGGAWIHYLPARDKADLNRALAARSDVSTREAGDWILLAHGNPKGQTQGDPIPAGDFGLIVRTHPLLAVVAQPGDRLELGMNAGGNGLDIDGRLVPGKATATRGCIADARAGDGGLIDLIPSGVGVRVETTLPPAFLARFLTRRFALHTGIKSTDDRVLFERFLRECLTGADPNTGLGLGLEFHEEKTTVLMIGKRAAGLDSPILARLRRDERSSYGPLVLDRRKAPKGVLGWWAWQIEPEPRFDGLPASAESLLLPAMREDDGLAVAYMEWRDWFAFAAGPRADLLVRSVRSKIVNGGRRSAGSFALLDLREADGDYVLGIVISGPGLAGMPAGDRAALAAHVGTGPDAATMRYLTITGHRVDDHLAVRARLRY